MRTLITATLLTTVTLFCAASRGQAIDIATPVRYTAMLMAAEFVGLHVFDINDESISIDNFRDAIEDPIPQEDDDDDLINYVLHPLMGSETYLRARESDFGVAGSILFSMAASLTWEYAVESWTEHPSSQDILFTTGIGWAIGELRHQIKLYLTSRGYGAFLVDPIWSTLEYFDVSITKTNGGATAMVGLRFPL